MAPSHGPLNWSYSHLVSDQRQARLLAPRTFSEIVHILVDSVAHVRPQTCRWEGFERPLFLINLNGHAADLFFNAPNGYRGTFCVSIVGGEAANRLLIDLLLPWLLDCARAFKSWSPAWTERSLRAPAAKIWIWEKGLGYLGFPWSTPEYAILYPVWVKAAHAYLRDNVDMPHLLGENRDRMADRLSFWGVRAPETQWIEVKGSWMKGGAPVATLKPGRSEQIRDWGWT